MVQIHGDIFLTRCSRCDFEREEEEEEEELPRCAKCGALMRPGVVWFGEMLDPRKIDIVENFLARGDVDLAIVVGTTALFGYILDWATRRSSALVEVNPEETPLSRAATEVMREPAAVALPRLIATFNCRGRC